MAYRVVRLELGTPVHCADAPFGELADIVIDPISRRVTHLVVQPVHRHEQARLVPIDRALATDAGISLDYSAAELKLLEPVQESAYLRLGEFPVADPDWEIGVRDLLALPLYPAMDGMFTAIDPDPHVTYTYDRIPKGEVEIRRSSAVASADDHDIGHVDGFVVDDGLVTGILLERGHLWGRREVVISNDAIDRVETDRVVLKLTKDEVGALETRRVQRWF
jgi:uncharacterized protein YrrD